MKFSIAPKLKVFIPFRITTFFNLVFLVFLSFTEYSYKLPPLLHLIRFSLFKPYTDLLSLVFYNFWVPLTLLSFLIYAHSRFHPTRSIHVLSWVAIIVSITLVFRSRNRNIAINGKWNFEWSGRDVVTPVTGAWDLNPQGCCRVNSAGCSLFNHARQWTWIHNERSSRVMRIFFFCCFGFPFARQTQLCRYLYDLSSSAARITQKRSRWLWR